MVGILELTFFLPQLDASCGQVDFHWHIYGNLDTNIFAFLCNVRFHLKSDILTDSDYLRCCPDLTPYEMSEFPACTLKLIWQSLVTWIVINRWEGGREVNVDDFAYLWDIYLLLSQYCITAHVRTAGISNVAYDLF